jgi:hypothetical protein
MKDIPLHDIKGLAEVPDNSYFYMWILIGIVVSIVLISLGIWIYKTYTKTQKENLRKKYLSNLKNIDFKNSKTAAYEISKYARLLAVSDREVEMLESLDTRLEKYKYKKDVEKLDDDAISYYKLFLELVNAS